MWHTIKTKADLPDFLEVLALYKCGSKKLGKLVWVGGEARILNKDGRLEPNYNYRIIAWLDIPDYVPPHN